MAIRSVSDVRPSIPPKVSDLYTANRRGWKLWLAHNTLYPRLAVALCAVLLCLTGRAHAGPLPSAPVTVLNAQTAQTTSFGAVDWSLAGGLIAGRALDFTSTSECLRNTLRDGCHEKELPNFLVHSKVGFAAFEVGAASLEVFSQYELTRHGHKRLARAMGAANIGLSLGVDAHNYKAAKAAR